MTDDITTDSVIWLHEDALRENHPVFLQAQTSTAIHVWDDAYLQSQNYSLKRLVFLYETLCELPVEIHTADTLQQLQSLKQHHIYIPYSSNPYIKDIVQKLSNTKTIHWVHETPLARLKTDTPNRKFFQYWKKAEKTVFQHNAGSDA